jgi:DNA-binding CsgD family transcriptional regulator
MPQYVSALTLRQREIADLLTEGWTTDEIAGMLTVTVAAIADDVERILRRLDPAGRAEVASWAGTPMRRLWVVRPESGERPERDPRRWASRTPGMERSG